MMLFKAVDLIMFADTSDHYEIPIGRLDPLKLLSSPFVRRRGRSFCLNIVVDEHFGIFI